MTRREAFSTRLLVSAAGIALVAQPAFAQDQTETQEAQAANQPDDTSAEVIVVTATKRASTVQDVPFSINAQTQEDIERANANTVEDLSRNVAGLTVQNLGPGQSQVAIRGVSAGQIIRDQPGVKEQVGVYMDESVISMSLFTPDFDLYDLNRVETLRGPQGTLFGSGSVGGTLRYITNQPVIGEQEASFEFNVNTVNEDDIGGHMKGMVNLDLGAAAARFVAYYTHYAGFIDALGPAGGENVNDGKRAGLRFSLALEPTDTITLIPRIIYQKVETNGFNRQDVYNLYSNPFTSPSYTFQDREQYLLLREGFEDRTILGDLTATFDIGNVELTSVSSYMDRDILVSRDSSALTGSVTVAPFISFGVDPAAVELPANLRDTTDLEQFTQEIRLASTGVGPLQWVIGGFYSEVDRVYTQRNPTPGYDAFIDDAFGAGYSEAVSNGFPLNTPYAADIPYDIKQQAIFGEASYDFGQFELIAGGRYYDFSEERDFVTGGIFSNSDTDLADTTESDGFSPRVIARYEPNANLAFNVQAAKGFRLGGTNDNLNLPLCDSGAPDGPDRQTYGDRPTYEDETLWNYEAGVKYSTSKVTFNGAVFYTDINNLQVTADAGTCSSRVVFNAPKAHTQGVELELAARPTPNLDLSVAGSWIEAEFDADFVSANGDIIAGIRDGNRLPSVPKFQMAASAYYTAALNRRTDWFVGASVQHVGSRISQPGDQEPGATMFTLVNYNGATGTNTVDFPLELPSYEIVNLSLGLTLDRGYEVVLYANNVLDENPLLSSDRERGGRARLGYNIGTPRTIGLTFRKRFSSDD